MLKVTTKKISALAEVCRNTGQVLLAAVVIEPIFSKTATGASFWFGSLATLFFFCLGIIWSDIKN